MTCSSLVVVVTQPDVVVLVAGGGGGRWGQWHAAAQSPVALPCWPPLPHQDYSPCGQGQSFLSIYLTVCLFRQSADCVTVSSHSLVITIMISSPLWDLHVCSLWGQGQFTLWFVVCPDNLPSSSYCVSYLCFLTIYELYFTVFSDNTLCLLPVVSNSLLWPFYCCQFASWNRSRLDWPALAAMLSGAIFFFLHWLDR